MESILDGVVQNYRMGEPPAVYMADMSVFHVVDIPKYQHLRPSQVDKILRSENAMDILSQGRVLIIRHNPDDEFDSFGEAVEGITQKDQMLDLQGMFLPFIF